MEAVEKGLNTRSFADHDNKAWEEQRNEEEALRDRLIFQAIQRSFTVGLFMMEDTSGSTGIALATVAATCSR